MPTLDNPWDAFEAVGTIAPPAPSAQEQNPWDAFEPVGTVAPPPAEQLQPQPEIPERLINIPADIRATKAEWVQKMGDIRAADPDFDLKRAFPQRISDAITANRKRQLRLVDEGKMPDDFSQLSKKEIKQFQADLAKESDGRLTMDWEPFQGPAKGWERELGKRRDFGRFAQELGKGMRFRPFSKRGKVFVEGTYNLNPRLGKGGTTVPGKWTLEGALSVIDPKDYGTFLDALAKHMKKETPTSKKGFGGKMFEGWARGSGRTFERNGVELMEYMLDIEPTEKQLFERAVQDTIQGLDPVKGKWWGSTAVLDVVQMAPMLLLAAATTKGVGLAASEATAAPSLAQTLFAQGAGAMTFGADFAPKAYRDLLDAGASKNVAWRLAAIGSVPYMAIEQSQLFLMGLGIGSTALKAWGGKTVLEAAVKFGLVEGGLWGAEVGEEVLQGFVPYILAKIAQKIDPENVGVDDRAHFSRIWEETKSAMGAMAVLRLPGGMVNATTTISDLKQAGFPTRASVDAAELQQAERSAEQVEVADWVAENPESAVELAQIAKPSRTQFESLVPGVKEATVSGRRKWADRVRREIAAQDAAEVAPEAAEEPAEVEEAPEPVEAPAQTEEVQQPKRGLGRKKTEPARKATAAELEQARTEADIEEVMEEKFNPIVEVEWVAEKPKTGLGKKKAAEKSSIVRNIETDIQMAVDAVPVFKDAQVEVVDAKGGVVKITRPDGASTTVHFRADAEVDAAEKELGTGAKRGAYAYGDRAGLEKGHIYLRDGASHQTLNHEAIHWLEDMGVVTAEEVKANGGREGIAEAYEKWVTKKTPNTLFEKIYAAIESLLSSQKRLFRDIAKRGLGRKKATAPVATKAWQENLAEAQRLGYEQRDDLPLAKREDAERVAGRQLTEKEWQEWEEAFDVGSLGEKPKRGLGRTKAKAAAKPKTGLGRKKVARLPKKDGEQDVAFAGEEAPKKKFGLKKRAAKAAKAAAKLPRRLITSAGLLPGDTFELSRQKQAFVEATESQTNFELRELDEALESNGWEKRRKLSAARVELLHRAYSGNVDAVEALPDDIGAAITVMRLSHDDLTQQAIDDGVVEGDLALTFSAKKGVHVRRTFRIHTDPNWIDKIPADIRAAAVRWAKVQDPTLTDAQAEGKINQLLQSAKEAGSTIGLVKQGSPLGAKDLGTVKKRLDLPQELLDLFGENIDPWTGHFASMASLSNFIANDWFLKAVKAEGLGVFLHEKPTVIDGISYDTPIADKNDQRLAVLSGPATFDPKTKKMVSKPLWTTAEIRDAFLRAADPKVIGKFYRGYLKVNSNVKVGLTVLSPTTAIRNPKANVGIAVGQGHLRLWHMRTAIAATLEDMGVLETVRGKMKWLGVDRATGLAVKGAEKTAEALGVGDSFQAIMRAVGRKSRRELQELIVRLKRNEALQAGARSGEMLALLKDAEDMTAVDFMVSLDEKALQAAARHIRGFFKVAQSIYQAGDGVFKIYHALNEEAKYGWAEPEWSESKLQKHAGRITRDTTPTYSMIGELFQSLRRFPLFGNFPSFQAERYRNNLNTLKLIWKELHSPNWKVRVIGAQRFTGMAAAFTIPKAIQTASLISLGVYLSADDDDTPVDDEEPMSYEEAVRELSAPWSKDSALQHFRRESPDEVGYIDMSYVDADSAMPKAVTAFLRGDNYGEALAGAVGELAAPFIDQEILAGALIQSYTNKKSSGGRVFNEGDTFAKQQIDRSKFVAGAVAPGIIKQPYRVMQGVQGTVLPTGKVRDTYIEIRAMTTGTRITVINIPQGVGYRARDFNREKANATTILSMVSNNKGNVSDRQLRRAFASASRAHKEAYDNMRKTVRAALVLGQTPQDVFTVLRGREVSVTTTQQLIAGVYVPFTPSRQLWAAMQKANPDEAAMRVRVLQELVAETAEKRYGAK